MLNIDSKFYEKAVDLTVWYIQRAGINNARIGKEKKPLFEKEE